MIFTIIIYAIQTADKYLKEMFTVKYLITIRLSYIFIILLPDLFKYCIYCNNFKINKIMHKFKWKVIINF